jgi:hypothetical protein
LVSSLVAVCSSPDALAVLVDLEGVLACLWFTGADWVRSAVSRRFALLKEPALWPLIGVFVPKWQNREH